MFPIYVDSPVQSEYEMKPLPAPIDKCILQSPAIHYHWDSVTDTLSTSHHKSPQRVQSFRMDVPH